MSKIKTVVDPKLAPIEKRATETKGEADGMLATYREFAIADQESFDLAGEALVEVKTFQKRIDEEKKSATRPLTGVLKIIRGWFAPAETVLGECEALLKAKVAAYVLTVEVQNREAVQAASAAYQAGDTAGITSALANVGSVDKARGVSIGSRWTFKICAVDLLPREYLIPDLTAIRGAMLVSLAAGNEEPAPIPGVTFYQDQSVSVRTA